MSDALEKARVERGLGLAVGSQFDLGQSVSDQQARACGLVAWTFPPYLASTASTFGNSRLCGVYIPEGVTITYMAVGCTSAAVSPTHATLGIYDVSMTSPVAQTADSPNSFLSTGWIELALTSPYKTPYSGLYYLAFAMAASTTLPSLLMMTQSSTFTQTQLPNGTWLMMHGPVSNTLPTNPTSAGAFSNVPLIICR